MECGTDLLYFIPGPVILFIGCILQIVAVSTSYWSIDSMANVGLWKMCRGLSASDKKRDCFLFSKRSHLPLMPFICSALSTIDIILLSVATLWAILSIFQRKSKATRWLRKAGTIAIISVAFNVFAVCLYAGSYSGITYEMIPKWSAKQDMTLGWSFVLSCIAACISLVGATAAIFLSLKVTAKSSMVPSSLTSHVPSLQIHPPPSSRLSTPSRFVPQRAASPLPFSRGRFSSTHSSKLMTPVHVTT